MLQIAGDAPCPGRDARCIIEAEDRQRALALRFGVARFERQRPGVIQCDVCAQLRIACMRFEPGPVGTDEPARIDRARQRDHAAHGRRQVDPGLLGHATLVVFEVGPQAHTRIDAPVERAGDEAAVAVADAIEVRAERATGCVDAHADCVINTKAARSVERGDDRPVAVDLGADGGQRRAPGALGDEVHDAGRRREAVVQRGRALEHLDALLVLHRHLAEVHERQRAIEAVVGAVFDSNATDDQLVPRVATVLLARHAGRIAHCVIQAGSALQLKHVARDDVDGRRHVHHVAAAKAPGFHRVGHEALRLHGRHAHCRHGATIGFLRHRCRRKRMRKHQGQGKNETRRTQGKGQGHEKKQ